MKILHTSDWHLGHSLHGLSRDDEHLRFLAWLLDQLGEQAIDVLLICGDIFDHANPPAIAQSRYYGFLAEARARFPHLQIVIIGGNHDSAFRLEAPKPLLAALNVTVVGRVPRHADGSLNSEDMCIPLYDRKGDIGAWCMAVPYLRPEDLPKTNADDPLIEGVRKLYAQVLTACLKLRQPEQAIVATGHAYMTGTALSEHSERKVLLGNQHALPVDIFDERIAYTALGHLHRPQRIGGRDHVRYSGAPIPFAMDEADYPHQVVVVRLNNAQLENLEICRVPRFVACIRLPASGPKSPDEVLAELEELPSLGPQQTQKELGKPGEKRDPFPYLEVRVLIEQPEPSFKHKVEEVLRGKAVRWVKLSYHRDEARPANFAKSVVTEQLNELSASDVFGRLLDRQGIEERRPQLMQAFAEIEERARCEEDS